jgi:outer membrane protein TolC
MLKRIFLILLLFCLTIVAKTQSRDLNFYLNEGIKNSPLLNDYRNQKNAATADSLLTRAAKKPFVEARSNLQYSPVHENYGYDEVITDGGNYTAVMAVSQTIFNKKVLYNKYSSIDLQKRSLDYSSAYSAFELIKIITDQYLTAFSIYTDLQFNKKFLNLSRDENEIVSQFVKSGVFKQADYLSLLIETQSQEIAVNQLEGQFMKELMYLNRLCGLNDTTRYALEDPNLVIRGIPDISKSPLYMQYKIDSMKIENERAAVDIRYRPKINWFADAGFLTSNPWNFYQHFGYTAGVSLNVPVYDGRQRAIEKQKLDLNENSRRMYEENYRKQYFQQIEQLGAEMKTLNETAAGLTRQQETSLQLVRSLKEQLETGIINMTDFVIAIKNYRNINRNIILVNQRKQQVINEMNFLMTQ